MGAATIEPPSSQKPSTRIGDTPLCITKRSYALDRRWAPSMIPASNRTAPSSSNRTNARPAVRSSGLGPIGFRVAWAQTPAFARRGAREVSAR
jgi:hypothetical protein